MITIDQLLEIMPNAKKRAPDFVNPLNNAMQEFNINNPARKAAFLAQVAHESGELRYVREIASGAAYEGRDDLGNTEEGDGVRYKGRGLIQISGRANYEKCGEYLNIDCLDDPQLLEHPDWATKSAAWFWKTHGLNDLADKGDFLRITKRINGGTNGLKERMAYYKRATQVLA